MVRGIVVMRRHKDLHTRETLAEIGLAKFCRVRHDSSLRPMFKLSCSILLQSRLVDREATVRSAINWQMLAHHCLVTGLNGRGSEPFEIGPCRSSSAHRLQPRAEVASSLSLAARR